MLPAFTLQYIKRHCVVGYLLVLLMLDQIFPSKPAINIWSLTQYEMV